MVECVEGRTVSKVLPGFSFQLYCSSDLLEKMEKLKTGLKNNFSPLHCQKSQGFAKIYFMYNVHNAAEFETRCIVV